MSERYYYVEDKSGSWFVCFASSRSEARTAGVDEWGRGRVAVTRIATDAELDGYCKTKSIYNYTPTRIGQTFEDVRQFQMKA